MRNLKFEYGDKKNMHLLKECIQLDKSAYEEKYRGNLSMYTRMFVINPKSFVFCTDKRTGKLLGYLLSPTISDKSYAQMRSGYAIDINAICEKDIVPLSKEGNNLYLYSVVVSNSFRGLGISTRLIDLFVENINSYTEHGFPMTRILADTLSYRISNRILSEGFVILKKTNRNTLLLEKETSKGIQSLSLYKTVKQSFA